MDGHASSITLEQKIYALDTLQEEEQFDFTCIILCLKQHTLEPREICSQPIISPVGEKESM